MSQPPAYEAFAPGAQITSWMGDLTFSIHTVANLLLPTGRIVVTDPFVDPGAKPLGFAVPPGEYAVRIAVAHSDGDERIACARIDFVNEVPHEWFYALQEEKDPDQVSEDDLGFPVDSATAGLMSAEAAELWEQLVDADGGFAETVQERLEANYADTREWVEIHVGDEMRLNAALFTTGVGDGFYPCLLGMTNGETPACLLIDFGLLDAEEDDSEHAENPAA